MSYMLAETETETRSQRAAGGTEYGEVAPPPRAKNRRQLIAEAAWAAYAMVQQNHGTAYQDAMNPYEDQRQRRSFERTYRKRLVWERAAGEPSEKAERSNGCNASAAAWCSSIALAHHYAVREQQFAANA